MVLLDADQRLQGLLDVLEHLERHAELFRPGHQARDLDVVHREPPISSHFQVTDEPALFQAREQIVWEVDGQRCARGIAVFAVSPRIERALQQPAIDPGHETELELSRIVVLLAKDLPDGAEGEEGGRSGSGLMSCRS